ncbi:MAG TPA: hypothetical protein VNO81_03985 [Candidatus Nitrosotenuis sp.]|nr:hypothetical protein [Candidatus Nitrosotenuis sp.]
MLSAPPEAAGLLPAQVESLRALDMPVVIPTYIPEGFHLAQVQAEFDPDMAGCYQLVYQGPGESSFTVEGACGGIGDRPRGEERFAFDNPIFGRGYVECYPDPDYPVDWSSPWLAGEEPYPCFVVTGRRMSPEEAIEIVASLRYLEMPSAG